MRIPLFAVAAALSVALPASAQDEKLKVGSKAPEGLLEHVEWVKGEAQATFAKDRVYVIEFWATWCAPCKKSIPHLTELQRDLGPRGLQVIGISDEDPDTVKRFVAEKGAAMDYSVLVQKKEDDFVKRQWMQAAGQDGIPCAFVLNRAEKIVFIGNPLDPEFDRAVKLTLANRYDPELTSRVEPTIAAARKAAKARNFKEAAALYDKAISEGPATLLDYGFECWRMMAEQAGDAAGAKAYLRKLVDGLSADRYSLAETVTFLSADPSVKVRDLETAGYAAEKLKAIAGAGEDPDCVAALASLAAAKGDFAAAAEMQYDAWMSAVPAAKPAFKRTLDVYESKKGDGGAR